MARRRRFKILETLGKGAFGTVYKAELLEEGGFQQTVALKLMHYEGEAADDISRRLRDEARILGLIRHRAIVGVHSLVHLEAGWAVVMQYIEGADLTSVIAAGIPPLRVSIEIVEDVASALHTAYTTELEERPLQLVHRDIKPSNIRITAQGEVKLLDFGVARAEFAQREAIEEEGIVFGSRKYMAPERWRGLEGPEGDIYGVGAVLSNLLTGRRFPAPPKRQREHDAWVGTVLEAVKQKLGHAEDPAERAATELVGLLMLQLLAWDPHDRPKAKDVERQLRKIRSTLPGTGIKDWAEIAVPRAIRRAAERRRGSPEEDTELASELVEMTLTGTQAAAGEQSEFFFTDDERPPAPAGLRLAGRQAEERPEPADGTVRLEATRPLADVPSRPPPAPVEQGLPKAVLLGAAGIALVGVVGLGALAAAAVSALSCGDEELNGEDDDCDGHIDAAGPWEGTVALRFEAGGSVAKATCPVSLSGELQDLQASTGTLSGEVTCTFSDAATQARFAPEVRGVFRGELIGTEAFGEVEWDMGELGPKEGTFAMEGDLRTAQLSFAHETRRLELSGSGTLTRPPPEE